MKARIHRVGNGPLVPYYSMAMVTRLGARLCGKGDKHCAEADIKTIEDLLQLADETGLQLIVRRDLSDKDCVDVCIYDDYVE